MIQQSHLWEFIQNNIAVRISRGFSTSMFTAAFMKFTVCVLRRQDYVHTNLAWVYLPVEFTSPPAPSMVSTSYLQNFLISISGDLIIKQLSSFQCFKEDLWFSSAFYPSKMLLWAAPNNLCPFPPSSISLRWSLCSDCKKFNVIRSSVVFFGLILLGVSRNSELCEFYQTYQNVVSLQILSSAIHFPFTSWTSSLKVCRT